MGKFIRFNFLFTPHYSYGGMVYFSLCPTLLEQARILSRSRWDAWFIYLENDNVTILFFDLYPDHRNDFEKFSHLIRKGLRI